MARHILEGTDIYDVIFRQGFRQGLSNQTLTGTYALAANAPPLLFLDPGGAARIVKMPPSPKLGQMHIIVNTADAAEIITIQDAAAVALVPPITPTQNETAVLYWSGATLGWRGFVAIGV